MKAQSGSSPDIVKVVAIGRDAKVWLRENITEKTKTNDGVTETYYEYDEYAFTMPNRPNVEAYVNSNLSALLERERSKAFDELKKEKLAEANKKKKELEDGGFIYDGILYDSDIKAETRYNSLAVKFSQNPAHTQRWKASGNTWVDMDVTLYQALLQAGEAHIQGIFTWLESVQTEINSATTVEQLMEVEI